MAFSKGLKLILFVAVSIATAPALAGTLYSSIPDLDVAPDGNVWYSGGIGCSQVQCRFVVDKFSLRQASQISAVQFSVESNYGASEGPHPFSEIGFGIFTDNNGTPGTGLFNEGTGAGVTGVSYTQTAFGTTIVTAPVFTWALFNLPAGNYWIDFVAQDSLAIPGYAGGPGDLLTDNVPYPYTFVPRGDSVGFTIFGGPARPLPFPETSTWAMMLIGFAGLGYASYRSTRRTAAIGP
jgi:hypothetical protein